MIVYVGFVLFFMVIGLFVVVFVVVVWSGGILFENIFKYEFCEVVGVIGVFGIFFFFVLVVVLFFLQYWFLKFFVGVGLFVCVVVVVQFVGVYFYNWNVVVNVDWSGCIVGIYLFGVVVVVVVSGMLFVGF